MVIYILVKAIMNAGDICVLGILVMMDWKALDSVERNGGIRAGTRFVQKTMLNPAPRQS